MKELPGPGGHQAGKPAPERGADGPADGVGDQVAQARVPPRDHPELEQLHGEGQGGAGEHGAPPRLAGQAEADGERNEEKQVDRDVGTAMLAADQAEQIGRARRVAAPAGRVQRGHDDEDEAGERQRRPRTPLQSRHAVGWPHERMLAGSSKPEG